MTQEALRMALEALEKNTKHLPVHFDCHFEAITAIKEALAQEQEPVATVESVATVVSESGNQEVTMSWWHEPALPVGTKLYIAPPQRTWVGLTDEEICTFSMWLDDKSDVTVFTAIEAKLKEKNTRQDGDCKHCVNGCHACDARRQSNVLP